MLYKILKFPARLAFYLYIRHISINNKEVFDYDGPLIIASNHPNSFLDAIIYSTLFNKPVHSLARGDVFKKPFYRKLLHGLNMLPVYRVSEGVENLESNYETFEDCKDIFRKNGIVLIFSEGGCVNEWHLRPLKKGTARLAVSSWDDNIPLRILPAALNYSSFHVFGKNIKLNFGKIINRDQIISEGEGIRFIDFNRQLSSELEPLVIEIPDRNTAKIRTHFYRHQSIIKKILLAIPAALGYLLHLPLYLPAKHYTKKMGGSKLDHYDSILAGMLFLSYPFYLLLMTLLAYFFFQNAYAFFILGVMPFCAWAYIQLKKQLD
ncbi:MAG: 1-acyl-sn-glycerol-3-phosphate acyltransferase [Chitinophagaceae bacterium]